MQKRRLKIALQKKGRLNNDSLDLLRRCGLKINLKNNALLCHIQNLPIDLLFVRDDDIPTLVSEGICDIGIVGNNVLQEKQYADLNSIKTLGFGQCRLSIAVPNDTTFNDVSNLANKRIATSYPNLLKAYLNKNKINASVIILAGSVEIAPRLNIADAICDLVSTGQTLEENNLRETRTIFKSEAVLIKSSEVLDSERSSILDLLQRRIDGVLQAQERKYIVFHAPKTALQSIQTLLPGCESPTILSLESSPEKVAVHVVSKEGIFWETLENLKQAGASSILILPIEKMME